MENRNTVSSDPNQETFDQYASSYSTSIEKAFGPLAKEHAFFIQHKAYLISQALNSFWRGPQGTARLLDVGCGTGTLHPHLKGIVREIDGFDVSERSIQEARRTTPSANYSVSEPGVFPCENSSYDCVVAICVLHHVPVKSRKQFFDEVRRVTKRDGIAIVIEHNPWNPATQWIVRRCPIDDDAVLLRSSEVVARFREAGFARASTQFVLFTPFKSRPFRELDRLLSWMPFGAQYMVVGLPELQIS